MTFLSEQTTAEIGGKTFTIRKLTFNESVAVYCRFQKLMAAYFDEDKTIKGLAVFQLAGLAGGVTADDIDFYIKAFGPASSVTFEDGRTLALKKVPATKSAPEIDPVSECFQNALEDLFSWLDECVRYNFGTLIEKTAGALKSEDEESAPKAQPKP